MLSRQNRYSFKSGVPQKSISTPLFVLRYQENAGAFQCAFVISKKVSKKAVERNRIKRTCSSIVEKIDNSVLDGYSVVFYLKRAVQSATPDDIKKEIELALERIKK